MSFRFKRSEYREGEPRSISGWFMARRKSSASHHSSYKDFTRDRIYGFTAVFNPSSYYSTHLPKVCEYKIVWIVIFNDYFKFFFLSLGV